MDKSIEEIFAALHEAGIRLWLDGGELRFRAPKGALTPELREAVRARREEIIAALSATDGVEIPRVAEQAHYELSHAQKRLWILGQMQELGGAYNIPLHQYLEGPLNAAALEEALARLVARHESLRTTFRVVDGEPRQVVHEDVNARLEFLDLSGERDAESEAQELARRSAEAPFDLEKGPLFRTVLARIAPERHALLFTVHHIVADGVSVGVIYRELTLLYAEAVAGEVEDRARADHSLPSLPVQYKDFAAWQNRMLAGDDALEHKEYWLRKLAGPITPLDIPSDFTRPPVQTFEGREFAMNLGRERLDRLRGLGRERGASLFMVLVAALKTLLHRYTGQEDIVIGCPAAGRIHADLEDQVGFFLNTLALRDHLTPTMTFTDLIDTVKATATEAYEHQAYPFDRLVEDLHVKRDLSRAPIFDVMAILQVRDDAAIRFEGIASRPIFEHNGTSKIDLTFNFAETAEGLILGIEYNTRIFIEERVQAMARHFEVLVDDLLARPDVRIGDASILSEAERRMVDGFSGIAKNGAPALGVRHAVPVQAEGMGTDFQTLMEYFTRNVERHADRVAVVHDEGNLTYAELDRRSNRIVRWLSERFGVTQGDVVALAAASNSDYIASLVAAMKLGAAVICIDPELPVERQAFILKDSRASAVIVSGPVGELQFAGGVADLAAQSTELEDFSDAALDSPQPDGDDAVLVFYTSGSTGQPKGVPLSQRNLLNELLWFRDQFQVAADDIIPQKCVVTFVDAIAELLLPITVVDGGAVHLRPHHGIERDFDAFFAWLDRIQPTILQFVPSVFDQFIEQVEIAHLSRLRTLILSGSTVRRPYDGTFRVYNLYGNTECSALSTCFEMTQADPKRRIPIGSPIRNVTIHIADEQMRPCPLFVPGEIYIGGAGVAKGYLNRPELTAQRFVPSPFREGGMLYRTGDFGAWLADGTINFLGRIDAQVKVRGVRIECGEIEQHLLEHPAVVEAIVTSIERGGEPELAAYVTLTKSPADRKNYSAELRRHLGRFLPDYFIPTYFVFLDAIPKTASGKYDRRALPDPVSKLAAHSAAYEAPRNDLERNIAAVWEDVLEHAPIGIHGHFLDLGGHSLRATRIASRLGGEFGLSVGGVDLFRYPTIAELADAVGARGPSRSETLRAIESVIDEAAFGREIIASASDDELAMLMKED